MFSDTISPQVSLYFATKICPEDAITEGLCETLDSLASGFDISNYNKTRLEHVNFAGRSKSLGYSVDNR